MMITNEVSYEPNELCVNLQSLLDVLLATKDRTTHTKAAIKKQLATSNVF
jgi:hypothetical protein